MPHLTAPPIVLFVLLAGAFLYGVWRATGPIGLVGGLLLHVALGWGLVMLGLRPPARAATVVQIDVRRPPPPPPPPPPKIETPPPKVEPPKPKPAPKVQKLQAPIPNQTPPKDVPPPAEPPRRVFGLTEQSTTTGDSTFSVPTGNSTVANPSEKGKGEKVQPLPAAPPQAASAPVFKAASALEVKTEPEVDEGSCQFDYPDGEAKQAGIEGDTLLRVEIDERGKVHGVKVLKGVGHGLDDVAMYVMRHKCHFTPARNSAGQGVAFVITYKYNWVLDR